MSLCGQNQPNHPDTLRRKLVELKTATLRAQARKMGLKGAGEDISDAAREKIRQDVAALKDEELPRHVAHWTELCRQAAPPTP